MERFDAEMNLFLNNLASFHTYMFNEEIVKNNGHKYAHIHMSIYDTYFQYSCWSLPKMHNVNQDLGQHGKVPPVSARECNRENPGEIFSHKSLVRRLFKIWDIE